MEFPHLGNHCHEESCHRLDFLPMKCGACSHVFCKDHFHYEHHACTLALPRDNQVPVCPLCNNPVPSKRGEQPDIAVGEHIDRDCQADPAIEKRKIYTIKCSVTGCKQKEVIKITCDNCRQNYCLKHRHPTDHKCQEQRRILAAQAAGAAAAARAQNSRKSKFNWFSHQNHSLKADLRTASTSLPQVSVHAVQGRMTEDEALARALHQSLNETKPKSVQEEEDRRLALALQNSGRNADAHREADNLLVQNRNKNCSVS